MVSVCCSTACELLSRLPSILEVAVFMMLLACLSSPQLFLFSSFSQSVSWRCVKHCNCFSKKAWVFYCALELRVHEWQELNISAPSNYTFLYLGASLFVSEERNVCLMALTVSSLLFCIRSWKGRVSCKYRKYAMLLHQRITKSLRLLPECYVYRWLMDTPAAQL